MRIGLLTSIGPTLDMFFPRLVEHWTARGIEVIPAAGTVSELFDSSVIKGITRRPALSNFLAPGAIRRWASEQHLDVIITNTATASALARVRDPGVPVIYFCHGLHWNKGFALGDKVWQSIEDRLLGNTSAVITMNSDDREWFETRVPADRLLYLRGGVGVPLDQYPPRELPASSIVSLLWAGEFSPRKRPREMVTVAQELARRNVNFRLVMIGDGALLEEVRTLVQTMGLNERIELPGRTSIQPRIADCHLMVHSALWEGLPRVLLEGYAMGRHTIAYDVKGVRDIPEIIRVKDSDMVGFADTIQNVTSCPETLGHHNDVSWLDSWHIAEEIRVFVENVLHEP